MKDVTREAICDILKTKRNRCIEELKQGHTYQVEARIDFIDQLLEIFD